MLNGFFTLIASPEVHGDFSQRVPLFYLLHLINFVLPFIDTFKFLSAKNFYIIIHIIRYQYLNSQLVLNFAEKKNKILEAEAEVESIRVRGEAKAFAIQEKAKA